LYSRRKFIQTSVALGAFAALPLDGLAAVETEFKFEPESALIPAPRDPSTWPEFRRRLAAWREQKRRGLNYSDAFYRRPWDTGTRREGKNDLDALVEIILAIEADGIFLDTTAHGAAEFRAKLDAERPGVVLESEGALPLERVNDHHLSWAQGFTDSEAPGILRNKWFERRHLQHQVKRWDRTGVSGRQRARLADALAPEPGAR